jgi:hypothetical protein
MAETLPYHTNSPEHRQVHHVRDDCPDGKRIEAKHRKPGTGWKPLCKECRDINKRGHGTAG